MTQLKKNIAVVAGRVSSLHRFDIFAALSADYNVTVLSLDPTNTLSSYRTEFKHIIFEEKVDMPGYMTGLENHLLNHDLIVAYETFQLSSFQACRFAHKHQLRFMVIADDFKPFRYVDFKNTRAIQSDVAQNVSKLMCSSNASFKALCAEGMDPNAILMQPIGVDVPPAADCSRLRQKFRKYIGVSENRILITIETSLHEGGLASTLLRALKLATEIRPELTDNVSLLIVGDGPQQRELKCLTYDSGLSRNVLFIHQDVARISNDIFASSDIYIVPQCDAAQPYFAPARAVAAGVWGALPLCERNPFNVETFIRISSQLDDLSFQALAVKLVDLCSNYGLLQDERELSRAALAKQHDASNLIEPMKGWLSLESDDTTNAETFTVISGSEYPRILTLISESKIDEAMQLVSTELQNSELSSQYRSQLQAARGQMLSDRAQYESAVDAYTSALSLNDKNVEALSGLGMLSFQTQSYEEAMKFFKRALGQSGENSESTYGLGMVYSKLGLHNDAIYWFERAIGLGNARPAVLTLLIQSCMDSKNVEGALATLERIEEIVGISEMIQMAIARLHVKLGNHEVGRELMRKVLAG